MKEKQSQYLCSEFNTCVGAFMKKHKVLLIEAIPLFATFLGTSMHQAKMNVPEVKKFLEKFLENYHDSGLKVKNEK